MTPQIKPELAEFQNGILFVIEQARRTEALSVIEILGTIEAIKYHLMQKAAELADKEFMEATGAN